MEKTPTAEEFLNEKFKEIYQRQSKELTSKLPENRYLYLHVTGRIDGREQNYPEMMIEFAKLHVEAALREVSNKSMDEIVSWSGNPYTGEGSDYLDADKIMKVYPEENIK